MDSEGKKVKFAQLKKVIDESVTKVLAGKTHRGKDLTIFVERPIPDEYQISVKFQEADHPEVTHPGQMEKEEDGFPTSFRGDQSLPDSKFYFIAFEIKVKPFFEEYFENFPARKIDYYCEHAAKDEKIIIEKENVYTTKAGIDELDSPRVKLEAEPKGKVNFVHFFDSD